MSTNAGLDTNGLVLDRVLSYQHLTGEAVPVARRGTDLRLVLSAPAMALAACCAALAWVEAVAARAIIQ